MAFLYFSGIIAIFFGFLILIAPYLFRDISAWVDKMIIDLDEALRPYRKSIGLVLIMIAGWTGFIVLKHPALTQLHFFWIVSLISGILYMCLPNWIEVLSKYANMMIFPTKEYVMGASKAVGTVIFLAGVYILVIIYLYR